MPAYTRRITGTRRTVEADGEMRLRWVVRDLLGLTGTIRSQYRMLRMPEMPVIDAHLVSSGEERGEVGEPAVPPLAAAKPATLREIAGRGRPETATFQRP